MKKPYTVLPFVFLICGFSQQSAAQNLAPNPSFEEYNNCITSSTPGMGYYGFPEPTVKAWALPTDGSTDYFNSCVDTATDGILSVSTPRSVFGYQVARTGNAYIGGILANDDPYWGDYREYAESKLLDSLRSGHRYFVSYWVNPADSMYVRINTDQFGAYFASTSYLDATSRIVLPLVPQVSSPVGYVYRDKENWEEVSGTFTATGGEQYIILGTFAPYTELTIDSSEVPVWIWDLDWLPKWAYYFLDDVCVLDLDGGPVETSFERKAICGDDSVLISGRPGCRYLWNDGETSPSRVVVANSSYWVKSIDTAACSGFYLDSFEIAPVASRLVMDLGSDTILCEGKTLMLEAGTDGLDDYLWNTGSAGSSILVSEPGQYYVYATGPPCYFGTDTIIVSAFTSPVLKRLGDTIVCQGNAVALIRSQPEFSYYWSTGEQSCCITVNETGNYIVSATDLCGDVQVDSINILFTGCDNCIQMPAAFTPNGDGLNDNFRPLVNCIFSSFALRIYNRWGQMVFVSFNAEDRWNGMINGIPADAGVYFYTLTAQPMMKGAEQVNMKGDITLLR